MFSKQERVDQLPMHQGIGQRNGALRNEKSKYIQRTVETWLLVAMSSDKWNCGYGDHVRYEQPCGSHISGRSPCISKRDADCRMRIPHPLKVYANKKLSVVDIFVAYNYSWIFIRQNTP